MHCNVSSYSHLYYCQLLAEVFLLTAEMKKLTECLEKESCETLTYLRCSEVTPKFAAGFYVVGKAKATEPEILRLITGTNLERVSELDKTHVSQLSQTFPPGRGHLPFTQIAQLSRLHGARIYSLFSLPQVFQRPPR